MSLLPIISIITPVFNGSKYIEETILSVITAPIDLRYEYLVLDDGSTDTTLEIINQYSDRIRVFSHENIGESETVNCGFQYARGKYLLVISADDPLLTEDLIHKAIKQMDSDNRLVAVYPDWKIINSAGRDIEIISLPDYSEDVMIGENRCLPGPGVVFKRDAAIQIGGRRKEWKFVGDYDFWLRLSRVGQIKRLPGVLAQWRDSSESTSVSQRGIQMAIERIEVVDQFLNGNDIDPRLQRMARANSYYLAARLNFFDPTIKGRSLLVKSFLTRRWWPEQAQLSVVIYLLLTPVSTFILKLLPKVRTAISSRE
jgi:glycosyltransferase involved in cell wall biosynthesis